MSLENDISNLKKLMDQQSAGVRSTERIVEAGKPVFKAATPEQVKARPDNSKPAYTGTYYEVFEVKDDGSTETWESSLPTFTAAVHAQKAAKRWFPHKVFEIDKWGMMPEGYPEPVFGWRIDQEDGWQATQEGVTEAKPVFRAAGPDDVEKRRSARENKIIARRKKDTVEDRVLGMEPEDVDPMLSMWFEDDDNEWEEMYDDEENKRISAGEFAPVPRKIFVDFMADAKKYCGVDLEPTYKRYMGGAERNESMFCQMAAIKLAEAGFYVYDSDSRFEVYDAESMLTVDYDEDEQVDIGEAAEPVFKPATQKQVAQRKKLQPPVKTIRAPYVKNEDGDDPDEEFVSIKCPHCGSLEDHPAEEQRHHTQHFDYIDVVDGADGHEYTHYTCQSCGKELRIKDMFESKVAEAEQVFKAASQDDAARRVSLDPVRAKIFQEYVKTRFPKALPYYIADWAKRFQDGMEWQNSDTDGRALLQKLGPDIYPEELDASFLAPMTPASEHSVPMTEAKPVFKAASPEEVAARPHKFFKVIYKGDRENPGDYDNFTLDKTYDASECHEADLNLDPFYKGDDPDAFIKLKNDLGQMVINPSIDFDFPVEESYHCRACAKDVAPAEYLPEWRTVGVCKACAETIEEAEKEIREERKIFKAASQKEVSKRRSDTPEKCSVCGNKVYWDRDPGFNVCDVCESYICDNCTAWKDSDTPVCEYHLGHDIDAAQDMMGEAVNEGGNPVFKAASREEVATRNGRKPLPPGTPDYKFLEFIVDPDPEAKRWKFAGIGGYVDEESSDVWFDKDGEPEFTFNLKTEEMVNNYLDLDKELSEECQEFFEKAGYGDFAGKNEGWIKSKGWTPGETFNTANDDPSYYWGEIFQYTKFETDDGRDGVTIMWHLGGDYRGNYAYPKVYFGDLDEVMGLSSPGEPDSEAAYLLGYDGDMKKLKEDIKNYRNPQAEDEEEDGLEGAYRPQRDVKNRGQMKWTFQNPENPGETQVESRKL